MYILYEYVCTDICEIKKRVCMYVYNDSSKRTSAILIALIIYLCEGRK